jgi:ADP-ribose pyrophosphatase YjhB (NUDIX family)
MNERDFWLEWAMELQSIAQNRLTYTKDIYDKERFKQIREISAEILSKKSNLSLDIVKDLFCNETGYQTPKLDVRAAIFKNSKILLVKEKEKWSLPGGWVDYNESIRSNAIKEVKEEAGLDIEPVKIIAVQDRNIHNEPKYAYGICKIFVLCSLIGGEFKANQETTESAFFTLDSIPVLATEKVTMKQIEMCFKAHGSDNWNVYFD